jgi:hypothetical protein
LSHYSLYFINNNHPFLLFKILQFFIVGLGDEPATSTNVKQAAPTTKAAAVAGRSAPSSESAPKKPPTPVAKGALYFIVLFTN